MAYTFFPRMTQGYSNFDFSIVCLDFLWRKMIRFSYKPIFDPLTTINFNKVKGCNSIEIQKQIEIQIDINTASVIKSNLLCCQAYICNN